jgi:hypothetical protein
VENYGALEVRSVILETDVEKIAHKTTARAKMHTLKNMYLIVISRNYIRFVNIMTDRTYLQDGVAGACGRLQSEWPLLFPNYSRGS